MALIRVDLGADALILSTRRVAQGVEVTAALEQGAEDPPALSAPRPEPAVADPRSAPAGSSQSHAGPPGGTDVSRGLAYHGIPASLATRLAGPDLPDALRASLRFGMLPLVRDGPPLLLAGMPGAGKTLTVARLATRLVLAGINPMVITADGRRAGAAEELAAYTHLLGIGLVVASTPSTLGRALQQRQPDSPVLIDTPGINPFADAELSDLRALAGAAQASCVLVMAAGLDAAEAVDQAQAFTPLGVRHLLPTRLDLTRRLGSLLGAAAASDLILTEAGIGTSATDGLTPLTPEFLADRLCPAPEEPKFPAPWIPGPGPDAARQNPRHTTWIRG